jgi:hypothetical protein
MLIIARFRYHLKISGTAAETILCEDVTPLAATGTSTSLSWLTADETERLLSASPESNLTATAISQQVGLLIKTFPAIQQSLSDIAIDRATAQLLAHERVREASRHKGRVSIEPVLPVDILGAYVLLPKS